MMDPSTVAIDAHGAELAGDLTTVPGAKAAVLFAHGSGSSRLSPRNRAVAMSLNESGFATALVDLLTGEEERVDTATREHRFDIDLLTERLVGTFDWLRTAPGFEDLPVGMFGASTGAAGALAAAVRRPVQAVVSRGGRPDLADDVLDRVTAPVLLIVGGRDDVVVELNNRAATRLRCPHRVQIVPGATHLFEEPGALERVAELAAEWFDEHLTEGRTSDAVH